MGEAAGSFFRGGDARDQLGPFGSFISAPHNGS